MPDARPGDLCGTERTACIPLITPLLYLLHVGAMIRVGKALPFDLPTASQAHILGAQRIIGGHIILRSKHRVAGHRIAEAHPSISGFAIRTTCKNSVKCLLAFQNLALLFRFAKNRCMKHGQIPGLIRPFKVISVFSR